MGNYHISRLCKLERTYPTGVVPIGALKEIHSSESIPPPTEDLLHTNSFMIGDTLGKMSPSPTSASDGFGFFHKTSSLFFLTPSIGASFSSKRPGAGLQAGSVWPCPGARLKLTAGVHLQQLGEAWRSEANEEKLAVSWFHQGQCPPPEGVKVLDELR